MKPIYEIYNSLVYLLYFRLTTGALAWPALLLPFRCMFLYLLLLCLEPGPES